MTATAQSQTSQPHGQRIAACLDLLRESLPIQRRVVHAGDTLYQAGERFTSLHVLNSGMVKIVNLSPDGREQVVGLHFRGDWLGFDGIASGHYGCDAVAMDTGEVWSFRYDGLLEACDSVARSRPGAADDYAPAHVLRRALATIKRVNAGAIARKLGDAATAEVGDRPAAIAAAVRAKRLEALRALR